MLRALLILLLAASPASAGPWPREPGEGYLSFSTLTKEAKTFGDPLTYSTVYVEYGLSEQITIGADLGMDERGDYKAILFAMRPFSLGDSDLRFGLELGVGAVNDALVLRPGLSLGKGYTAFGKSGWMSVETLLEFAPDKDKVKASTDVTLGLSLSERSKWIMQLQTGGGMADPDYIRLAPSYVRTTKTGRQFELGLTTGIKNTEKFGIKFGVWKSF